MHKGVRAPRLRHARIVIRSINNGMHIASDGPRSG